MRNVIHPFSISAWEQAKHIITVVFSQRKLYLSSFPRIFSSITSFVSFLCFIVVLLLNWSTGCQLWWRHNPECQISSRLIFHAWLMAVKYLQLPVCAVWLFRAVHSGTVAMWAAWKPYNGISLNLIITFLESFLKVHNTFILFFIPPSIKLIENLTRNGWLMRGGNTSGPC